MLDKKILGLSRNFWERVLAGVILLLIAFAFGWILLSPRSAEAQVFEPEVVNREYIAAIHQVIALLIQQVQELTRQLQEIQKREQALGAVIENPTPILPRGIETNSNKDLREGVVYPRVKLRVRIVTRTTDGSWASSLDSMEREIENGVAEITINRPNNTSDRLRVLYLVGNPDDKFIPSFACFKTGDWQGDVAPHDHWEENVKVEQDSTLGVKCRMKDGSYESIDTFKVIVNK